MQMSEMGILAKVDPLKAADLCPYLLSEEQEVHTKLHVVSDQLQNHHKENLQTSGLCVSHSAALLLQQIHQVCNVKLPLSPQTADSEGGVNAQTVTAAWNPYML